MTTIEMICTGEPTGTRPNEDAYWLADDGDRLTLAVIDGVTDRLIARQLRRTFAAYGAPNGSAYAARRTREVIAQTADRPLIDRLLAANDALREAVQAVYGAWDFAHIARQEPALAAYQEDPRYVRLILPACVLTLVSIDRKTRTLDYAHLGDSELFFFRADGGIERVIQPARPDAHQAQPVDLSHEADPTVRHYKTRGLAHNFTTPTGQTRPTAGIGVLNGQPQAADYILSGQRDLTGVQAVLACTDGLLWPHQDYKTMRDKLTADGITAYVDALRAAEAAATGPQDRAKVHDDATGLLVWFQPAEMIK
jgi:hypothetical protein